MSLYISILLEEIRYLTEGSVFPRDLFMNQIDVVERKDENREENQAPNEL